MKHRNSQFTWLVLIKLKLGERLAIFSDFNLGKYPPRSRVLRNSNFFRFESQFDLFWISITIHFFLDLNHESNPQDLELNLHWNHFLTPRVGIRITEFLEAFMIFGILPINYGFDSQFESTRFEVVFVGACHLGAEVLGAMVLRLIWAPDEKKKSFFKFIDWFFIFKLKTDDEI